MSVSRSREHVDLARRRGGNLGQCLFGDGFLLGTHDEEARRDVEQLSARPGLTAHGGAGLGERCRVIMSAGVPTLLCAALNTGWPSLMTGFAVQDCREHIGFERSSGGSERAGQVAKAADTCR